MDTVKVIRRRMVSAALTAGLLVAVSSPLLHGQGFAMYAEFQAMTLDQLKTLQVKLTYMGLQTRPVPSLVFASSAGAINVGAFEPFRRPGLFYGNDDVSVRTFTATVNQLDAVIDRAGELPAVVAGGVASDTFLSFSMLNTAPATKAFEAVLDKPDTADLFAKLRQALQDNPLGLRRLEEMACAIGVLDPQVPTDVSAGTDVAISGVRLNRATGRFVGTATITNTSGSAIAGPVSIILDLAGSVRLFNATGTTCKVAPLGREFIKVPLTGPFAAGASVKLTLEFDNPERLPVQATDKVVAGPGAP